MNTPNKKILILSHTGPYSTFKIGSHHYANMLSELGYSVYYSGISNSFFHKLRRFIAKENKPSKKIKDTVIDKDIKTFLPLTMKETWFKRVINDFYATKIIDNKIFHIEYDIVICDYPFFYPVLKNINYKKLIYRPTDNYAAMSGPKVRVYESKICLEAYKIISTSDVVRNELIENYGQQLKDKTHVIENGYDQNLFYNKNETVNRNHCVYIGALDYRFDFIALKHLAENNPNVFFDIYGPIPKNYSSVIKPNFLKCENVTFKGELDYLNVPDILNRYKVGLLPLVDNDSNKGRSPMKLWEYLSCGLNVVYANIDHVGAIPCLYRYSDLLDIDSIFKKAYDEIEKPSSLLAEIESNSWSGKVNLLLKYMG
ncbi:hypothetical protein HF679_02155 [Enterobacter sp. JUb54]|uniref:hypothetical protein n=1 Tax=Enterobacter sp. JUb54 TaxID=2724468 RepID=UPI00164E8701|nr:hypothetical protein [Enterobacter sp. JUb54]QNK08292.1 hypothetical protein HF679_02155 [Enterobacter sp. JUb54]